MGKQWRRGSDLEAVEPRGGAVGLGEMCGHGSIGGRLPGLQSCDLIQNLLHHIEGFELLQQRLHRIRRLSFKPSWFSRRQDEDDGDGIWWKKFGERL